MAGEAPKKAAGEEALSLLREPRLDVLASLMELSLKGAGLAALPEAITHCQQLVQLEVTGNPLEGGLPASLATLPKLDILFASNCGWTEVPAVLASCPQLRMLGMNGNRLTAIDGLRLPEGLQWLIAASNAVESLPNIARVQHVRKLMLSHNRLTCEALAPIAGITDLEMIRVAANRLEAFPEALMQHPRLAWVAVGGNPFAEAEMERRLASAAPPVDFSELEVGERLGGGAGGGVYHAKWRSTGEAVAVKLWDGERFSDGTSRGEWAVNRVAGTPGHPALVRMLGAFELPRPGLVLELMPKAVQAAAGPNFQTVTRDSGTQPRYTAAGALFVARAVASACEYLHSRGVLHGDVYLHNTLVTFGSELGEVVDARLSDFGAAAAVSDPSFEKLEVRTFGWLIEDLLDRHSAPARCASSPEAAEEEERQLALLRSLRVRCAATSLEAVPRFTELVAAMA